MDIENNSSSGKYEPHPESVPLTIHSYGFGGVRYDNIIMLNDNEALIPGGVSLSKWDIKKGRRINTVQTNNDSIFVLLETGSYIISISYSGQVSILDRKDLFLIKQFYTTGRIVRHASVNEQYLSISCEEFKDQKGITVVYNLQDLISSPSDSAEKSNHFTIIGRYRFGTLTENGLLVTLLEKLVIEQTNQDIQNLQEMEAEVNQQDPHNKKANKKHKTKHHKRFYELIQFDLSTKEQTLQQSCPYVCDLISGGSNNYSIASFLYQDRHLIIIDLQTLKILSFTKIGGGKGSIMTLTYPDKNTLLFSPASNYLLYIDCNSLQGKELPRELDGSKEGIFEGYRVQALKSRAAHPENYFIKITNDTLFASNEGGFIQQNLKNLKDTHSFSGMNITCCGLATNPTEQMVAVGDFLGNVYIYPAEKCAENDAIFQTNVMSAIRSLDWDETGMTIAIGTMEGTIYKWQFQDYGQQPQVVSTLKGSITCLRYKELNGKQYLLATTTEGQFGIFEENYGQNMITNTVYYGHLPQDSSDRFGSLDIFAEIWSTVWSCSNANQIATCSEDQTVHIFDLKHRQPLQTHELKGHTLAVTSVDWKEMNPQLGEVFISCSDDQTIRVYNPKNNFELVHVFTTSFVREWHTLTYLALEQGGTRVAIGSQNGYFFIYDLVEKKFTYSEKIHMGGIEGLVWKKNRIFTCSSDCCVNVIEA